MPTLPPSTSTFRCSPVVVCSVVVGVLLAVGIAVLFRLPKERAVASRPTLFLIGDSTMKNKTGEQTGWGTPIEALFEPGKISIKNRAMGGRSSRTFLREGHWEKVLVDVKPGDFVLMQFGHNDNVPGEDRKASLEGNGDEAKEEMVEGTGAKETVRSYGWYLRKYIADTRAKGATPIVCSLIARNRWSYNKVVRATDTFTPWAREAAAQGGCQFIDLNELTAQKYEELGREKVQALFIPGDQTHTNLAGAEVNARLVAEAMRRLEGCALAGYLRPSLPPAAGTISNTTSSNPLPQ